MDPLNNPFSPGAGSRPPELAGRDQIVEQARVALGRTMRGRNDQSQILLGLRGTGKTVLLTEIETVAERHAYLTSFLKAPEDRRIRGTALSADAPRLDQTFGGGRRAEG